MNGGFLVLLLAMFGFMYFLLIRPQRQQQRKHTELLSSLKPGDEVVTAGGIYGEVVQLDAERVMLEIDEDVRIAVARRAIASVVPPEELERLEDGEEAGGGGRRRLGRASHGRRADDRRGAGRGPQLAGRVFTSAPLPPHPRRGSGRRRRGRRARALPLADARPRPPGRARGHPPGEGAAGQGDHAGGSRPLDRDHAPAHRQARRLRAGHHAPGNRSDLGSARRRPRFRPRGRDHRPDRAAPVLRPPGRRVAADGGRGRRDQPLDSTPAAPVGAAGGGEGGHPDAVVPLFEGQDAPRRAERDEGRHPQAVRRRAAGGLQVLRGPRGQDRPHLHRHGDALSRRRGAGSGGDLLLPLQVRAEQRDQAGARADGEGSQRGRDGLDVRLRQPAHRRARLHE